jgi:hypothetical protein
MYGADISLKHQISEARYRELLSEADRQRAATIAVEAQRRGRRSGIAEARATVATILLRTGSWIMPKDAPDGRGHLGNRALELRPGQ